MTPTDLTRLDAQLQRLHLHYIQSHYQALATRAAEEQRSHLDYLEQLVEGEATPQGREAVFVAGEEMLHGLGDGELHEHLAAERQHHLLEPRIGRSLTNAA
jgi:hypothetical protein